MLHRFKTPLIIIFVSVISIFTGMKVLSYFTHSDLPEINIYGLQKDGYYSNTVECSLVSDNSYKIDNVNIFLDGKELNVPGLNKIGKKSFKLPFTIETKDLKNGKHCLDIQVVDASYNKNKNEESFDFYVDNTPLKAAFLQQEYKVEQGRTIHAKIQSNKKLANTEIQFLEKTYKFYPESEFSKTYECFIPLDCEQKPGEYMLNVDVQDFVKNKIKLTGKVSIKEANFPKQKGFSVAQGKLEEEKEISMSNKILEEALEKWLEDSPDKKLWSGNFELPIDVKRVSTPFGEIRTSAEKGRYLHKAVDVLNYPRSIVWASQDGRVIIKDRFLLTGNTVVVDHGIGIFTMYCHLEDFADIEVGDIVKKGNPLGRLGMTGYANGYHLHWELRVNNVAVDPFQWTKRTF
ncbi:peptidoglycan DD-metalloendopeptidase family protein [Candidatus Dependentiae bacterium]|nr:peptidoglycan DD-metalloendopeptidase family protein [Candidatus Dependentiae bacterium]